MLSGTALGQREGRWNKDPLDCKGNAEAGLALQRCPGLRQGIQACVTVMGGGCKVGDRSWRGTLRAVSSKYSPQLEEGVPLSR